MKRYSFEQFKLLPNADRAFEVPFFMTSATYNYLNSKPNIWNECTNIAAEYGFNCIYVTDNIEGKGKKKVWEKVNETI